MTSSLGHRCPECLLAPDRLEALLVGSPFEPRSVLQKAIHAMKYGGQQELSGLLVARCPLSEDCVQVLQRREAVLVPVPLARERLRERGYNQAAALAQAYSSLYGLPMAELLLRQRATAPQATLGRLERQENVRDAFVCTSEAPRVVVLVDDVATTLSTLHACAVALRQGGTQEVWGLVLARARRHG